MSSLKFDEIGSLSEIDCCSLNALLHFNNKILVTNRVKVLNLVELLLFIDEAWYDFTETQCLSIDL